MHRTFSEEDYEQKRDHLRPFIFAEPLKKLSPIPEHRESIASPHPQTRVTEFDSTLPELIIEPRRYEYEDETDEFYDKLEIRMKMFYQRIFLGEDIDIEDIFNEIPDYSNNEAGGNGTKRYSIGDAVDPDGADDDSTVHLPSEEEVGGREDIPDADQDRSSEDGDGNGDGKSYASRDETDVADSEDSHATFPEYTDKSKLFQEKRAGIFGKSYPTYSISSSEENSNKMEDVCVATVPSQTFTENLDVSEEYSSTQSKTKSEFSEVIAADKITEQAIVHFVERDIGHDREFEVMRRQKTPSLEDSFIDRRKTSNNDTIDLNIRRYSIEEERSSNSVNTSVPMDIESFVHHPRIFAPLQEVSPVIPWKRPATDLPNVSAKKKKKDEHEEKGDKSKKTVTVKINQRHAATETDFIQNKNIQVNIPLTVENTETQTDAQERKDAGTQMSTDDTDASIRAGGESLWVECRNVASQTEREMRDVGTQTRRSFEYYRLFDEINFYFIF